MAHHISIRIPWSLAKKKAIETQWFSLFLYFRALSIIISSRVSIFMNLGSSE